MLVSRTNAQPNLFFFPTGHYMLVSRTNGEHGPQLLADLQMSVEIGPTPPSCQLHFSYFISREGESSLSLLF